MDFGDGLGTLSSEGVTISELVRLLSVQTPVERPTDISAEQPKLNVI